MYTNRNPTKLRSVSKNYSSTVNPESGAEARAIFRVLDAHQRPLIHGSRRGPVTTHKMLLEFGTIHSKYQFRGRNKNYKAKKNERNKKGTIFFNDSQKQFGIAATRAERQKC